MAFMKWDSAYNTGIRDIDLQHQQLMKMINELYNTSKTEGDKELIAASLTKLINYAAMHFAREERYFDEFNYPETDIHKKEHVDFENRIAEFELEFDRGEADIALKIVRFLSGWLIGHIQGSDQLYAPFLKEHGVK